MSSLAVKGARPMPASETNKIQTLEEPEGIFDDRIRHWRERITDLCLLLLTPSSRRGYTCPLDFGCYRWPPCRLLRLPLRQGLLMLTREQAWGRGGAPHTPPA